jgi:1-acyl-sn-glycerol-3-phosphate acyltransferase
MATRREVLANIARCEQKGTYNEHVDPFNPDDAFPVDEHYPYIPHGFYKIKNNLLNTFVVWPYINKFNRKETKARVFGRENLKGIKSAIVTSNHVYMFDCLSNKYAFKGHKLCVTAAYFNNLKNRLGDLMRAGHMLPIKMDLKVLKKLDEAIGYYLKHHCYILFYPEEGMWWYYEKPRPLKNGAFHYARRFNVPVVPSFITYRDSGKVDGEGLPIRYSDIHILRPIYPDLSLSEAEDIVRMRRLNHQECVEVYEQVYQKKYVLDNFQGEF